MGVKITGVEQLLKNIEAKLGAAKTTRVVNKVLNEAGKKVEKGYIDVAKSIHDKGHTEEEVVRTNARKVDGVPNVRVGLRGPHNRYAIMHLNEFGFTRKGRRITPRGYGKLQAVVDKSESVYRTEAIKGLEELLK